MEATNLRQIYDAIRKITSDATRSNGAKAGEIVLWTGDTITGKFYTGTQEPDIKFNGADKSDKIWDNAIWDYIEALREKKATFITEGKNRIIWSINCYTL